MKSGRGRLARGYGGGCVSFMSAIALSGGLVSPVMASSSVYIPLGQDMSYGGVSHPRTIQATGNNPASPVASERRGVWFGLGAVSAGYEVGPVDDLMDRAEDLEDALDRTYATQQEAEDQRDEFNAFLRDAGRDGYFKLNGAAKAPFTPLGANISALGGTLSLDATAFGTTKGRILDEAVTVTGTDSLETDTAAYLKSATGVELSVGYSDDVFHNKSGSLFVGGRLNYYSVELGKGIARLDDGDENTDFSDEMEDDLDRNTRSSSGVGVDVGAIWAAENYRFGGTLRNINEPEFDYPEIVGTNAAMFGDSVNLNETYTMDRQLQVEGAVFSASQSWHVSAAYDVNSSHDPVGDEYQWAAISTGFAGSGWLTPGFRVGYRTNLAGTELSYYTAGLTLFRVFNLDAALSTDTVDVDGDKLPRSAMISASLEMYF